MAKDTKAAPKAVEKKAKPELVRTEDGTIELNITVKSSDVEKTRAGIEDFFIKNVSVPGFRKGMAPKETARKSLNQEKVNEELLKEVVTVEYKKAIEKHKIEPIINPQVHIEAFEKGQDLKFSAKVAEEPIVELGEYKKAIKDLTAKSKIITKKDKEPQKPSIDDILMAAVSKAKITIPNVIVDREVERLLAQMIDEIRMLGMTLESYLESKKITVDMLKEEYRMRATRDIMLEFFLRKVADEEKITVTADDITNAISKIEDSKQKEEIEKNPYLIATIIRQQKTIDFLSQI